VTASRRDLEWAISLEAQTERLADVRSFVEQVAAEVACDLEQVFDLKVAVCEAFANAVEHARCTQECLEVSAKVQAASLTFVVADSGCFRPPSVVRGPANNRGLGLPLMVTLMDEVSFRRAPGGGTQVSLSVRLDRSPAATA
jgi:anti-sigma regulatory factor (Ser/Thr protein kinase)